MLPIRPNPYLPAHMQQNLMQQQQQLQMQQQQLQFQQQMQQQHQQLSLQHQAAMQQLQHQQQQQGQGQGGVKIETPDILLQPVPTGLPPTFAPPSSSPYSRAHSLPSTSPALNHQHSMESTSSHPSIPPTIPPPTGPLSTIPPPGLESFIQQQYPAQYKQALNGIDMFDYKQNKHSLPLARIKKIMKSDEDVRMISAEAPVLFAKACELFILDISLRAWAHVEHASAAAGGPKRRTLQRNDIAVAIQNSELFDFLHQIVPVQPYNPEEEGTPPHHLQMEDEPRYNMRGTPDVLLQRPLNDPYGDTLPPVHGGRGHGPRNSYQRAAAAAALAAVANQMNDVNSPMTLLASPANMTGQEYGMATMSRGISLDPNGNIISTPVLFNGLPLELIPDTPSLQGGMGMGMGMGIAMTPSNLLPPTPSGYAFQPGTNVANSMLPVPNTPLLQTPQQYLNQQQYDPNQPPNTPLQSTPSTTSNPISINTPNFQSGYSAEGSEDAEEQLDES